MLRCTVYTVIIEFNHSYGKNLRWLVGVTTDAVRDVIEK